MFLYFFFLKILLLEEFEKFKEYVLEKYDDNCDGKISMDEVSIRSVLLINFVVL